MVWLFAIVVLILLVLSPQLRKLSLWLVALVVIVGTVSYLNNQQERAAALSRIPASQLGFENVSLKTEYGGYKILGRIKNNSPQFTLSNVVLAITMQDCAAEATSPNCITIGQDSTYVFIDIPPGQARDFDESLYFSGGALKPKGHLVWNYSVAQTEGK